MCAVLRCPAAVDIQHGTFDNTVALWGSIVNYECDAGYEFSDGTRQFTMECLETEQWNATVTSDCTGKLIRMLIVRLHDM